MIYTVLSVTNSCNGVRKFDDWIFVLNTEVLCVSLNNVMCILGHIITLATLSFHQVQEILCGNAVKNVTVKACLSSSCVSVPGIINMSADGSRRVMATFTNLEENRKYSASVHVQYNGGVVSSSHNQWRSVSANVQSYL